MGGRQMPWFRRRMETQEPVRPDVTPLSDAPWSKLHGEAEKVQLGPGATIEASRRVVIALGASEQSATKLGKRIERLNLWLLIFTIAICGLSVVLVLVELGVKRPHEQRTGGAWVLWMESPVHSKQWSLRYPYDPPAFETKKECDEAARLAEAIETSALADAIKRGLRLEPRSWFVCLPDTVDPRGPKGKWGDYDTG